MSFDNIYVNDYGQVAKITFLDVDTAAAANISGYSTSQTMIFIDPNGTQSSKTAAFDSDGTDGIIKYTIASSFLTVAGKWKVRGQVASASARLSTAWQEFEVLP